MARKPAPDVLAYEISSRVAQHASLKPPRRERGAPGSRPLRIYTLDPSVSDRVGGVATVQVPYEKLDPGPVGALFRVECGGAPRPLQATALDLDRADVLISSGLTPTPANGQFHLQMVYAVCTLTYAAFKRALGRNIGWATPLPADGPHRLTLRPFGFRGANAGYSRETGDISFGYFEAGREAAGFTVPKGLICSALSHDVIVHETTHALLDGLRSSFLQPSNVDVLAFHEGFADLVALFLHFTYADVVEQAIRESRGNFKRGSMLTDLAREFGYARSKDKRAGALRSGVDVDGVAAFDSDVLPSDDKGPQRYDATLEPHALGSVLVSAVFEAFATIVRRKTERYFRIAGLDPQAPGGAPLSDALVKALAQEASDVAGRFLDICIRGVDYCPPADMELGEYLRALITADGDLEQRDKWGFREALMRSFRRRHIFPDNVRFMTEDAVRWQPPESDVCIPELAFRNLRFDGEPGQPADAAELERQAHALGKFVTDARHARGFGLVAPSAPLPKNVLQASPAMVQSLRVARRVAPDGRVMFDLIGEVTQTCTIKRGGDMFEMCGGATVVIDPEGEVRYKIYKRVDGGNRQSRQHTAMRGPLKALWKKSQDKVWKAESETEVLRLLHFAAAGRKRG